MQTSIVNYKNLNSEFRIDAEYYRAEVLNKINLLDKVNNDLLKNLVVFVIGPFGSTVTVDKYVDHSDFRYVRNKDIDDFVISDNETACIPSEVYNSLPHFHIHKDDLLITVVGTLGKVAIARAKDSKSIFSCKSTIIRSNKIDPWYLLTYLNSTIGQIFALRGVRGAIQQGLNLSDLQEIKVFVPSESFQKRIKELVTTSLETIDQSIELYKQAEEVLLSEINLLEWEPKHRLSFIKKFSDTKSTSRIDAEYYQPKYEEIVAKVKSYKNDYKPLGEIIRIKDKNLTPKDETSYKYIELANVSANGNINGFIEAKGKELPTRARRRVNSGDVIVSSIEGALSSIALVTDDLDNSLCSTGFFVINSDKINSETLLVLLKSLAWQLQLKKGCSGTILTAIGDDEFKKIILPVLPSTVQGEIKKKISEMYSAKALSKHLLDIAKRSVEIAIEKSEKESESWIDTELRKLDISL